MSQLQEILRQLDILMSQRSGKDESMELIVQALHAIASDHQHLKSKVGDVSFSSAKVHQANKGGVG
jgi:hypothetical protein